MKKLADHFNLRKSLLYFLQEDIGTGDITSENLENSNKSVTATDYDLNGTWDTTRYTDWQKVLIGGTAQYSNFNVSFSGGVPGIQYFIGGTYHRETSVFPGNFVDKRGTVHFNSKTTNTPGYFTQGFSPNIYETGTIAS